MLMSNAYVKLTVVVPDKYFFSLLFFFNKILIFIVMNMGNIIYSNSIYLKAVSKFSVLF